MKDKNLNEQIRTLNVMYSLLDTIDGEAVMLKMGFKSTAYHRKNIERSIEMLQLVKKLNTIIKD